MSDYFVIILGVFSVIQALLLPGMIVLRVFKFSGSGLQKLIYSVALSLICSYLLVLTLVLLHIYSQGVLLLIFSVEIFFLLWLFREIQNRTVREILANWEKKLLGTFQKLSAKWLADTNFPALVKTAISLVALILSFTLLWWSIKLAIHYSGTIFDAWDAIVSWNQWALSWANGTFPSNTRNYPQLVPINYSLAYVFIGNIEIQFFSKFLVLPMAFLILLMPFDLGLQTKKSGYFLATIIIYLLLKKFLVLELTNGYVDGVMAFFALLSVYTLIKLNLAEYEREKRQLILLGFVFAGAAAVVKQPGILIFILFPIWLYFGTLKQGKFEEWKNKKKYIYSSALLSVFLAIPWYVYKQFLILFGNDRTGISELLLEASSSNYNVGWFQQIIDAISKFETYLILFPIILLVFFILKPLYRWLVVTLVLPYPILWALIASYDARNLSIFIPIFGLVGGVAIEKLLDWGLALFDLGKIKLWMVIVVVVISLGAGLMIIFPNDVLIEKHVSLQAQLFSANKNAMLYDLLDREGMDITILTSYPLRFLPGFGEVVLHDNYRNYDTFSGKLESLEVDYLLVPEDIYVDPQINDYIIQRISDGTYELVWEDKSWKYYKLLRVVK